MEAIRSVAAMKDKEDHLIVGSVLKAFKVLEAFDRRHPSMGFSEISRVTGLEKSAAQRAAHTLWHLGYLDKAAGTGEYRLALRCHDVGTRYSDVNRIVNISTPYITFLRKKTSASVNLTMLDGTETVFVQRNTNPDMAGNALGERARLPAYCTATGIAMLSQLDDGLAEDILKQSDPKPLMPNTVWEIEKIMARIKEARFRGFALGIEEDIANDITLACGFCDPLTREVAALGMTYSSERIKADEAIKESRDLLIGLIKNIALDLRTN